jgi:hypothetical protein
VGRPGINGPGDSVANISPVLLNTERIRYGRHPLSLQFHSSRRASGMSAAKF